MRIWQSLLWESSPQRHPTTSTSHGYSCVSCTFSCDSFCIIHQNLSAVAFSGLNVRCPLKVPCRRCHWGVSAESQDQADDHSAVSPSSSTSVFPGRARELAKGGTGPFHLLRLFFNSPFNYGASSGTLTARRGGEVLWSLTEPTFRSIINLGASSVRRRLQEKSNKFDTDTWRLYPHRASVSGALLKSHTRILTLNTWTMSVLLLGLIAIFLW